MFHDYFRTLSLAIRGIPRWGWACIIAMSAAATLFDQFVGRTPSTPEWIALGVATVGAAFIYFAISIAASGERPTLPRVLRYAAGAGLLIAPVGALLLVLILAVRSHQGWALLFLVPAMLALPFLLGILSGWPLVQARAGRWIGLGAAWAATKGLRWPLAISSFAFGATDRATSDADLTKAIWVVAAVLAWNCAVSVVSSAFGVGVSVVAARHMETVAAQSRGSTKTPDSSLS